VDDAADLLFRLGAGDDFELARGAHAFDPVAQIPVGHRTSPSFLCDSPHPTTPRRPGRAEREPSYSLIPFVPAKAGTQSRSLWPLGSRLRGNERSAGPSGSTLSFFVIAMRRLYTLRAVEPRDPLRKFF